MSEPLSSNPPAAEWLQMLLSYLWEQRGTDLHLTAGSAPLARVDGELHAVPDQPVLTPADTDALAATLLDDTARQTFGQREVGKHTESFARVRRSALREDPDILMVGEMRDLESIDTVLTLAETGHLVIATLHTNDTTQGGDRLVAVFPGGQQSQPRLQLPASLAGVIYQRLLPRREGGLVAAYEVLK